MSVQVAKSSTPTAGRRTPLQMGGAGKPNKSQQQNAPETEKEKDTPTKEQNPPSTSITNPKVAGKGESTDLKKGTDKKNTNADNQTTENSNSAKDKTGDEKKKEDKKKEAKEAVKKDDKKQENGVNEGKEANKANGHKEADKKIRETPRQKDLREQREKEEKEQEAKKLKEAADELKKNIAKTEEVDTKNEPKEKEQGNVSPKEEEKELEMRKKNRKEPETPKKGEKKSRDADLVTPTKETQISPKTTPTNKSVASLAFEKDLKGFTPDGEEMESLLFDTEAEVNDGGPVGTSTPGRVLKLKQSPPKSGSRSYERQEIYERYGQVSTTKSDRTDRSPSGPLERPQFTASYRSISGRRSLRPAKEYSFHGSSSGTYRKISTELDYTTSSMNATVGSEIQNESSFSLFGRGKKRERTPPVISSNDSDPDAQVDVELSPKSPKRPRLDFSGILGIVASPVTMLRAKLSRTKIQSSTPNGKVTSTTSKDEEDGVENVSVIATDEMPTTEVAEAVEDVSIQDVEQEDLDEDELIEDADEELEEPADLKKPLHTQQLQQPVSTSMDSVSKRRMCNVM